jgi:hopanoid biosynthesis associated protein HpnK
MRQLIVNADDFGLTIGVTEGILDAHRQGTVTSTTLMANGAAFRFAVAASRRTRTLGVGVHLNLSEGLPVAPARSVPTLLDQHGRLQLKPGRLMRGLLKGRVNLDEVETELRAQITKVVRSGISPTHLDGHKHVHVVPGVADIVIRLAREFNVPSVRCPVEDSAGCLSNVGAGRAQGSSVLKQYLVARAVSAFARRFRQKLERAGLLHTTHFYGLACTGFLHTQLVRDLLGRLPEGTSELMCHPGYTDDSLAETGTRLLVEREVELFALCSPQLKALVTSRGIRLEHYGALPGRRESGVRAA